MHLVKAGVVRGAGDGAVKFHVSFEEHKLVHGIDERNHPLMQFAHRGYVFLGGVPASEFSRERLDRPDNHQIVLDLFQRWICHHRAERRAQNQQACIREDVNRFPHERAADTHFHGFVTLSDAGARRQIAKQYCVVRAICNLFGHCGRFHAFLIPRGAEQEVNLKISALRTIFGIPKQKRVVYEKD